MLKTLPSATAMDNKPPTIIGLDIGERRIGVATAPANSKLAFPLTTIANDENVFDTLLEVFSAYDVLRCIVGYPRNMHGEVTAQTKVSEVFGEELRRRLDVDTVFQDESLTSRKAEAELDARGKPYEKGDVDALAATYILQDYLESHKV